MELKPCIQSANGVPLEFLLCERTDRCVLQLNIPASEKSCAQHVAEKIDAETLAALHAATSKKGYKIAPIEFLIARLQNSDWPVTIVGEGCGRDVPLTRINKTYRFVPLELDYHAVAHYAARASAQDACLIFNVLSNVAEKELPFKPKPSLIGQIGTSEHALQLTQFGDDCAHNEIWQELGQQPMPRTKYCEKELEARLEISGKEVVIRGHADALLKIIDSENNVRGIMVVDLKHRQYNSQMELEYFVRQTLIYGIAASQITEIVPEYYLLVTARSPFGERPGYSRKQVPVITREGPARAHEICWLFQARRWEPNLL
ncbi:MAG: hypothetical protein HYT16_00050 [DPANN group archaeon]|nr:hypothetical protein [DPANN group archaeon]